MRGCRRRRSLLYSAAMPVMQSPPGAVTRIDGREFLYFVGTGYLGLQGHPDVIRAACDAAEQYGIGSANSRTAFGTTPPLLEVERLAAALFGLDDAFYYASGWMGAGILLQALNADRLVVFIDECSHYSLFEAARWTGRPSVAFRHRDGDDLREKLKWQLQPGQCPIVLSDGVFAATGRIAPADRYCEILRAYPGSILYLDDAHGLAVLGEHGRGVFEHFELFAALPQQVCEATASEGSPAGVWTPNSVLPCCGPNRPALPCPALLFSGTLSKAVGGFGGIIPGGREFIGHLKSRSPCMAGASAPPAPVAAATARALELTLAHPDLRTRLRANARQLKDGLRHIGFDADETPVPIVSLALGSAENMQRIQQALMARGIAVAYMPTYSGLGPEGALRLAVFATHTEEMIARLVDELRQLV